MVARIDILTRAKATLEDITHRLSEVVRRSGVEEGVCHLFVPHTTAGIIINENDDPEVGRDILARLEALVPSKGNYHHLEGNAPAHIKASLVGSSQTVPIEKGRLVLGRWQGVFLCEFDGPRERSVLVQVMPAAARPGQPSEREAGQP
ncbi:MAG: secondary thiamine-phosphate synthase enzyme YjbQ [Chloroflexota bacterium]|nr:secondary thiamine-phosphate synthase enzyme YjbQ [Chloroflexota bacterium]